MPALDPSILRMLIDYDPETGVLLWKERPRTLFRGDRGFSRFNRVLAGRPALISRAKDGYLQGGILERDYKAHRVAWAIYYGQWPTESIDHINGDPADNRIANLREVDNFENQKNRKTPRSNTSGRVGVQFCKASQKWVARIGHRGKKIHLGAYPTFDAALTARVDAEARLGFHENHGRAANNPPGVIQGV